MHNNAIILLLGFSNQIFGVTLLLTINLYFSETKNFVELLFKTLETQEYVLPPAKVEPDGSATPPGVNPPAPIMVEKVIEDSILVIPAIGSPPSAVQVNGSAPIVIKRESRKSDSEKEDRDKEKRPRSRYVNFKIFS